MHSEMPPSNWSSCGEAAIHLAKTLKSGVTFSTVTFLSDSDQDDTFAADYCYPPGFGFEWGDDPIQDDPDLFDMNIQARCDAFAAEVRKRSLAYRHDNILIPFGCDFQYMVCSTCI